MSEPKRGRTCSKCLSQTPFVFLCVFSVTADRWRLLSGVDAFTSSRQRLKIPVLSQSERTSAPLISVCVQFLIFDNVCAFIGVCLLSSLINFFPVSLSTCSQQSVHNEPACVFIVCVVHSPHTHNS